jgi:hypothetical protein
MRMLFSLALLVLPAARAQDGMVAVGPGTPDFYVIQPGDTLWDISTRFLADPEVWPELWSYNEYITNPHWIYPGNKIYFRLGDPLNPPSAGISEPVADGYTPPRPVEAAAEVACDFPARFDRSLDDVSVTAPGVIAEAEDLGIRGHIIAADEPGVMLGEGAFVYIRLDEDADDDVECGQVLAIYKRQGHHLKGPDDEWMGYPFRVLALVQVLRVDDGTITAQIRDSYSEVARGDLVGDPIPVEVTVDVDRPDGDDLEATIIARLTEEQELASTGETVFLDRGTNDGIDVGQALFIVERRDAANLEGKPDDALPERVVGRVVIVRSEPAFSTGVVMNAARDVQVGQRLTTRPNSR